MAFAKLKSHLRKTAARTLAVIPEGVSLNYLARLPTPGPFFEYAPATLALYGQDRMLADLTVRPPDLIVLISRDIREFGFPFFGSEPASGQRILQWLEPRYDLVARVGGHPLDPRQQGAFLLRRKPD